MRAHAVAGGAGPFGGCGPAGRPGFAGQFQIPGFGRCLRPVEVLLLGAPAPLLALPIRGTVPGPALGAAVEAELVVLEFVGFHGLVLVRANLR